MAFCTSCGAAMDTNSKFCTSCGATIPTAAGAASAPASGAPGAAPVQAQGSNVFKVVLIVLGVVFAVALIAVVAISYGAYRLSQNVKVEESGDTTKVETPFGTIQTDNKSAEEVARNMGVPMYPGATAVQGNAVMELAGKKVAAANFESDDEPQKVFDFYKEKYPHARVVSQGDDQFHIMAGDEGEAVNIAIQAEDGKTKIAITKFEGND